MAFEREYFAKLGDDAGVFLDGLGRAQRLACRPGCRIAQRRT